MTNTMSDLVDLTNHAAQQSDRWLFIALLVLAGVAILGLWRWMVSDRKRILDRLDAMTDRHIVASELAAKVIAGNTHAMHGVEEGLRSVEETITRCWEFRKPSPILRTDIP
jgi:ABC-type nickel/cobalt efflux system permease component RcnA